LFERQSPFAPHAAPPAQLGWQAGATQRPAVQTPEPQSNPTEQAEPSATGWQTPAVQTFEKQSALDPQATFAAHPGAQDGAPHFPAEHSSVEQSEGEPHEAPSVQ